ncbi:DUF6153 family protein [Nakamurella sp.]|uniref:DUF6153 family protein n=1 Tax=Nakamurella sp. TaxID=1869182 RepID=UPI0037849E84
MPTTRSPLARWVLLLAVIAGVIGMHVLTAGDGPGHGMLPAVTMAAGHHGDPAMAEPASHSASVEPMVASLPPAFGHGDMAGCILFLVVGGALLLLALALARAGTGPDDRDRRAAGLLLDLRRRGPPDGWPRIALRVLRV